MAKVVIAGVVVLLASVGSYFFLFRKDDERPCIKLLQACEAAGFKRGQTPKERRDFFQGCMRPLMENQPVGDIQIKASEASACRQQFMRRQAPGGDANS